MTARPYRRKNSVLTASALSASAVLLLAACGSSATNSSGAPSSSGTTATRASARGSGTFTSAYAGKTLTILEGAPAGATAKKVQAYDDFLSQKFHQITGANLKPTYYSTPQELVSDIETAAVSGTGPDVVDYGGSVTGTLAATGEFPSLSASDWHAIGGKSLFIPAGLTLCFLHPGKYIAIPNTSAPYVLAYNKAYFRKAGVTTPPKTWSQLVSDAQKVQQANSGVAGIGMDPGDPYDPWKSVYFLAVQMGAPGFVSANGKAVLLDSPQVEKATEFYFSLYYKYHVVPQAAMTWNSAEMSSAFEQGKTAIDLITTYGLPVQGTKLQNNLGYAQLPTIPYGLSSLPPGGRPIETETTGSEIAISKYAGSLRPLALELDKISVSAPAQLEQFKLAGSMPTTYPGVKAVERYDPSSKPFISSEEGAYPTYNTPAWSYIETGMETALNNIGSSLARTGNYITSYADGQLHTATVAAQPHLR